ncbi:MAG: hypothetical protein AAF502_11365 [Bacteroidota bacterium]
MKTALLKVAIRQNALYVPAEMVVNTNVLEITETTSAFVANCAKLGFSLSEDALRKVNGITPSSKLLIFNILKEITGVNKNWTPLVRQWDIPTGETVIDHLVTLFANVFKIKKGTTLPCGHLIPDGTFPLERYNGCPFCGTPFQFGELDYKPGKNKLKTLQLWTESDLQAYMSALLASPVALDGTQINSLEILLAYFNLPENAEIAIKETMMVVVDALIAKGEDKAAGELFSTPNDILRYLWYKNTGFLQIVEPKTIVRRKFRNARNLHRNLDNAAGVGIKAVSDLKLKYTRAECKRYAGWLNDLEMDVYKQCEIMHPKRSMWVRFIRALRLAEYSKRKGFDQLAELLDVFYNEKYEVFQGKVNHFKLKNDADKTFRLLKSRPGLFARSLFSSMLWFGKDETLKHFREVMNEVPSRLIFTLNMYAEIYFDKRGSRSVKPLGGTNKRIPVNKLLQLYNDRELSGMQEAIQQLGLDLIRARFEKEGTSNKTIFIDSGLDFIPIAIGDRSENIQDLPAALMGTRFPVEGDTVRLFMQWGEGLKAQHLDMDLSCKVAYKDKIDFCSYAQLTIPGCKHSGDIRHIPAKVGTAEYIDVNIEQLAILGARYVSFTCNAYSNGSITPNLVVGWMHSKYPMRISKSGVAYDPTAVQHQVRITQGLTKGMVFGVLDVKRREVIWLELAFGGQIVQNMSTDLVETLLTKLDAKLKIGQLLKLKAEVQNLEIVNDPENADEVYDMNWALNTAEVNQLFLN